MIDRRQSLLGFGLLPVMGSQPAAAAWHDVGDTFKTYMRMFASTAPGEHWWWFSSHWDLIVPGKNPVPTVGLDTLVRRRVTLDANGRYKVRGWESIVFWDLKSGQPIDRLTNPITGREVTPFHATEGPVDIDLSPKGIVIGEGPGGERVVPLDPPTLVAGDDIWMKRAFTFDRPHPLDIKTWKQEVVTDRYWANIQMVYHAKLSAVRDDSAPMAMSTMMISGQTIVVPWMMMGGTNAMTGWAGYGKKMRSADELPADRQKWYRERHPEMFVTSGDPWKDYTNPFLGYGATHNPA